MAPSSDRIAAHVPARSAHAGSSGDRTGGGRSAWARIRVCRIGHRRFAARFRHPPRGPTVGPTEDRVSGPFGPRSW